MIRVDIHKTVSFSALSSAQVFVEMTDGAGISVFDERSFFDRAFARKVLQDYRQHELRDMAYMASRGAVLVCDETRGRLILAADSAGHSTFYYLLRQGQLIFSSRLQDLDEHFRFSLSARAAGEYLSCGFIAAPLSIFEGVFKLPPGGYLLLENGRIEVSVFRSSRFSPGSKTQSGYQQALESAFQSCLDKTPAGLPGLMLSGGYDSCLLGELLLRRYGRLSTWAIDMMGYNAATVDQARQMSRFLETEHTCLSVSARDYTDYFRKALALVEEPLFDLDFAVIRQATLAMGKSVRHVWHGFGSDEVLGERVADFRGVLADFAAHKGRSAWRKSFSVRQTGRAFLATKVPQELRAHYRLCEASGCCLVFPFFEPELVCVAARMPLQLMKNKKLLRSLSPRLDQKLPVRPREERGQLPALIKHVLVEGHKQALLADSFLAEFIKANDAGALFNRKNEDLLLRMTVFLVWKQERDRRLSRSSSVRVCGAEKGDAGAACD